MQIGIYLCSIIFFLFIYWKRLREDYTPQIIFSSGFITLVLGILLALIGERISLGFWGMILGSTLGFWISRRKYHLRPTEGFEAMIISLLLPINFIFGNMLQNLIAFGAFLVFFVLDSRYKRFTWYKSGKVGFAGIASVSVYFLIRSIIALALYKNIADVSLSAIVAFILFGSLYNLSQR